MPRTYAITGPAGSEREWWRCYDALLERNPGLVQIRVRHERLNNPEAFLARAVERGHQQGNRVLLNGLATLATSVGADGVHCDARSLLAARERPLAPPLLVGASCHDAAELAQAVAISADFACLSPVFPTRSHPDRPALGLVEFERLVNNCPIPVFALGGADTQNLEAVRAAGGWGIAGISAYWEG
ncbi:MAG: thiamine phosphate synthase [Xanthomonadales bacterium]|nr:thiamine phosphate synthase [Xanthomonadales bacterium]